MYSIKDLVMRPLRLYRFIPYIVTFFIFVLVVWSTWFLIQLPNTGFSCSFSTGNVGSIDSNISSTHEIIPGDQVISIDAVPLNKTLIFPDKKVGEYQTLLIKRNGNMFSVDVLLQKPTILQLYERLSPVFIGILFLLLGITVYSFIQPENTSVLFSIYCQGLCLTLIAGSISGFGLPIARETFGVLLCWIGPLALHAHLKLIKPVGSKPALKKLLLITYTVALFFCILYLWPGEPFLIPIKEILFYLLYLWLIANLGLLVLLLFNIYRHTQKYDIRKIIGIIFFSFICGIGPFLFLSLFPELIFSKTILPYELSFTFLLLIPFGYSLAIFHYKLIALDRHINRAATKFLLTLLIVSLYGFIYLSIPQLTPNKLSEVLLSGFAIIFILIFTYGPLSHYLQRIVDRILYGGWYDDNEIIQNINLTLKQSTGDPKEIANSLCLALQKTLQLEYVHFLFPTGELVTINDALEQIPSCKSVWQPDEAISLFSRLSQLSEHGIGDARVFNKNVSIDRLIFGNRPQLWFLLKNQTDVLGLLILGNRRGGEFDRLDLNTLVVVTRQASYAIENANLLAQVHQQTIKVQALNNQMMVGREEERLRLARELHDQILQSLYSLKYRIFIMKKYLPIEHQGQVDSLQNEIQTSVDSVRNICADLRPAALDSLGLIPAISDLLQKEKKIYGVRITFEHNGDELQAIPAAISITVYRILQECLSNVQKHANANNVKVQLKAEKGDLELIVNDDGQGFVVTKKLESFTSSRHFGLSGIQERLNSVGGQMDICSSPGQGCRIRISIPIETLVVKEEFHREKLHGD